MNSKLIRNSVVAVAILAVGIFAKGKLSAMATKEEIRDEKIKPRVKVIAVHTIYLLKTILVEKISSCLTRIAMITIN